MHRSARFFLAVAALFATVPAAFACPFCSGQGQTLTMEINQATMVLVGELTNPVLNPGGDFSDGTTDLVIDTIVKHHEALDSKTTERNGKKVLVLPRYVPVQDPKAKNKFLIFCDIFKGKIDPYRGIPLAPESAMGVYLKGALEVKEKPAGERLRFAFDYLDNGDLEISNDAFKEFANADYKDYREMAAKLPAEKVARWIQDEKTAPYRIGTYASFLGHCGTEAHASLLRSILDDRAKLSTASGIDGMLAGLTMLQPKDGWAFARSLLGDTSKEFLVRYAALKAARFFWEYRPDLVEKKDLVAGISQLLDDKNMADLAIEDLRKWQRWETAERVLELYHKESHNVPIIRRAILRYALVCPEAKAVAFVAAERKKDAAAVTDVEELLKLESLPPTPPTTPPANGKPTTK